jgi:hypothetical protein
MPGAISPADIIAGIRPLPRLRTMASRRAALETYLNAFQEASVRLSSQLRSGAITIEQFYSGMRQEIKFLHTGALIISRGGEPGAITFSEWGRVGAHLRVQYRYLNRFVQAIQNSAMDALQGGQFFSEKYLQWRAQLYGGAARASFYRGMAYNLLPQVPGDGNTQCLTNCKCTLRFEEVEDEPGLILVFWELHPAEHCDDCVTLSEEWNPYELYLPVGLSASEWVTWLPKMETVYMVNEG